MAKKHPSQPKRIITEKERKLMKLISANFGTKGSTKTMEQLLLEAGYSKTTARQQTQITKRLAGKENQLLKNLIHTREILVGRAKSLAGKAGFRNATDAIEKFTKVIQLLQGRPTEIINLSPEEEKELDDALNA